MDANSPLLPGYNHPSLSLAVTEPQRDRALTYLQGAYADGRLTAEELDQRVGVALTAGTRGELNAAFTGLVRIPLPSQALGVHPAYAPMINQERDGHAGRGGAGFAHFSALFTWIFGPAITYAATTPGTYAHREAAKSFNFQMVAGIGLGAAITATAITGWQLFGGLIAIVSVAWFVLTIVGGARAASGEDWKNPVTQIFPLRLLDESTRKPLGR